MSDKYNTATVPWYVVDWKLITPAETKPYGPTPIEACHAALKAIESARRHVEIGSDANPDDMTFDEIENSLKPITRLLHAVIEGSAS